MLKRLTLFGVLSVLVLGVVACAPADEPAPAPEPVAEEAPPPPPAPTFELTEVAISEELPDFTSRNVTILGVKVGDVTNSVVANLGEQTADTINGAQDYLTVYHDGGIVLYTFKQTGIARRIEVTTTYADEIVDPNLRAWLEDGDQSVLRAWLGPEEELENVPENNNATEFGYDSRGMRFVQYFIDGQDYYAVRFSQLP
jgi:hypothetical protein